MAAVQSGSAVSSRRNILSYASVMLPNDFKWTHLARSEGPLACLRCSGTEVARMCARADGGWVAVLNQHLTWGSPTRVSRRCTTWKSGHAGIETWAARHADQIRLEVAQRVCLLRRHPAILPASHRPT